MRVLQIIDSLQPGGAERMAVNIANALAERDIHSCLCASRQEGTLKETINDQVNYLFAARTGKVGFNGIRKIKRFIDQENITILHVHSSSFMVGCILKIWKPSLHLVWNDHYGNADLLTKKSRPWLRKASFLFDAVIVVNQGLKKWCLEVLNVKHVELLDNFSDLKLLEITNDDLPGIHGKRVVHLANYRPQKNHRLSILAFAKAIKRDNDWSLLLVGKSFNDAYYSQIKNWIAQSGAADRIHLLEDQNDIPSILENSDIGLLSSHSEGLPLSLLEYGIFALPSITTNVGDCARVVDTTGIVVDADNRSQLAEALSMLMNDSDRRNQMGEAFQKRVESRFSKKSYLDKVIDLYNRTS